MNLRAVLLLCIALVALSSCSEPGCGITVVAQSSAPGNRALATIFKKDCGATTLESTQVLLSREVNPTLQNAKGLFVIETAGNVTVSWQDEKNLTIVFPTDSTIYTQEKTWHDITITYQPNPAVPPN